MYGDYKKVTFGTTYAAILRASISNLSCNVDISFLGYVKQGKKNFILVPIAFVNEHIETLHEMDIEYCHDLGKEVRSYIYFVVQIYHLSVR